MCIAKIAFNALFRPSKHLFTPKTPFAEKVMGPNFKHLYDTSSAASRLVKTWDKEIIPVNTFDSLTLEGWFYTAGENARDTAILVHGYNSSPLGDMSAIMQFYLRRGINVLLTTVAAKRASATTSLSGFTKGSTPLCGLTNSTSFSPTAALFCTVFLWAAQPFVLCPK